jgi:hypothetical protein
MYRHNLRYVALLLVVMTLAGCAAKTIHPGAVSQFDSQTYDTLLVAQDSIETAKKDVNLTSLPAGHAAINTAIMSYNTTMDTYLLWKQSGSGDQSKVSAAIAKLLVDVAQIQKAAGKQVQRQ